MLWGSRPLRHDVPNVPASTWPTEHDIWHPCGGKPVDLPLDAQGDVSPQVSSVCAAALLERPLEDPAAVHQDFVQLAAALIAVVLLHAILPIV